MDNNNNQIYNENMNTNTTTTSYDDWPEPKRTRDIIKCVLSIVNVVVVVPIVAVIGLIFLFDGLLFGNMNNIIATYIVIGYVIVSFIFMLISIWNVAKHSKVARTIFIIIIVLDIVSSIAFFGMAFDNIKDFNINSDNVIFERKEAKDETLYVDDNIKIDVYKIYYRKNDIRIYFELNNNSDNLYNFKIDKVIINDIYDTEFIPGEKTGLSIDNKFVESNNKSGNYDLIIKYSDLKVKKEEVKKLSFKIKLVYLESYTSNTFEYIDIPDYVSIEFK